MSADERVPALELDPAPWQHLCPGLWVRPVRQRSLAVDNVLLMLQSWFFIDA